MTINQFLRVGMLFTINHVVIGRHEGSLHCLFFPLRDASSAIYQFLSVYFSQSSLLSLVCTKDLSAVFVLLSRDPSCLRMTGVLLYRLTVIFNWRNVNQ